MSEHAGLRSGSAENYLNGKTYEMSFDSLAFASFFIGSFFIYWRLRTEDNKRLFLTTASIFFYGFWDVRYVALMAFVIAVAYAAGRVIADSSAERVRKVWLALAVASHLSVLLFFKYFDFFADSSSQLSLAMGWGISFPRLDLVLPIGISFYTFHAISYTVDVFRRKVVAERDPVRIALYISFFPQLIAGPIVRSTFFLPQMQIPKIRCADQLASGVKSFALGFVFKTVLADNLATVADPVFAEPAAWSTQSLWIGALAYYGQIYFDFAGYSLMAIGTAAWFGYTLPDNFLWPYTSSSVTEFWRRWHVSLSTWLRDYLYIPLGGGRRGRWTMYVSLSVTMLLGGLWHGASWNFVIWGALHGFALCVHKTWREMKGGGAGDGFHVPGWLLTQLWVVIAWVFFRCQEFHMALEFLAGMFGVREPIAPTAEMPTYMFAIVLLPLLVDALAGRWHDELPTARLHSGRYAALTGCALALALWLIPLTSVPFIYFQF